MTRNKSRKKVRKKVINREIKQKERKKIKKSLWQTKQRLVNYIKEREKKWRNEKDKWIENAKFNDSVEYRKDRRRRKRRRRQTT